MKQPNFGSSSNTFDAPNKEPIEKEPSSGRAARFCVIRQQLPRSADTAAAPAYMQRCLLICAV